MNFNIFLWGVLGSFAVEVGTLYQIFLSSQLVVPPRYKMVSFWIIRVCLALVAGTLPVAFGITLPAQALAIGVAAPFIIHKLGQVPYTPNDKMAKPPTDYTEYLGNLGEHSTDQPKNHP
jgi:hypothetical protein